MNMRLKPVIASYSGEAFSAIERYLTQDVLEAVASIARAPQNSAKVPREVIAELVEMHVLNEQDGPVRLDTAVFMRDDIERILNTVRPLAKELSRRILVCGSAFQDASPEVTIFLGGIVGLVQGSGMTLRQKNVGVDWQNYPGKYAQSKVDFDELCDVYDAIGPDFLNKSVLRGERYTAVFIGPGGDDFFSLVYAPDTSDARRRYARYLNRYLADAYALLVTGKMKSAPLRAAAEAANLYEEGRARTAVITNETIQKYEGAIQVIIDTASAYYGEQLGTLDALLRSTTSGRQGVPVANMMLNLWRYIRKVTAKELYANGFFTDTILEKGTLTVFYENNVEWIRRLL
jgi:hypothetical protein